MNKYIIILFLILVSTINVQADPFNVTTVLSVPHLTPGIGISGLNSRYKIIRIHPLAMSKHIFF